MRWCEAAIGLALVHMQQVCLQLLVQSSLLFELRLSGRKLSLHGLQCSLKLAVQNLPFACEPCEKARMEEGAYPKPGELFEDTLVLGS